MRQNLYPNDQEAMKAQLMPTLGTPHFYTETIILKVLKKSALVHWHQTNSQPVLKIIEDR